jgi:predicted dehydrogenase
LPEPLRIAFLGRGFITGVHSRALQSLRGVIECGYASRDRAKADECCRRYSGVASLGDYTSAIGDPRVDAVVVAVRVSRDVSGLCAVDP